MDGFYLLDTSGHPEVTQVALGTGWESKVGFVFHEVVQGPGSSFFVALPSPSL